MTESGDFIVATGTGRAAATGADSGEEIWAVDLGAGVRRSIALEDGIAYFGLDGGEVVALSETDGSERWRVDLATSGAISTPTVANGMVYAAVGVGDVASDRRLVALDAATGAIQWTYVSPLNEILYSPAVVDGIAYVVGHDQHVVALDATTGALRWSVAIYGVLEAVPVVTDGVVYVAANDRAVIALDATTGDELWRVAIGGVPWSPAVTGGFLLIGTNAGILYAIGSPDDGS
jgi:outer membrane protein assembly factor BamB